MVAIEFGCSQGRRVETLLRELDYAEVEIIRDLAGNERVVTARRGST
jgi:methylase of polypeptide subunit release factors